MGERKSAVKATVLPVGEGRGWAGDAVCVGVSYKAVMERAGRWTEATLALTRNVRTTVRWAN